MKDIKSVSYRHPILIFDGTCVLCNGFFQWVIKHDKREVFVFSTIEMEEDSDIVKDSGDTLILIHQGKIFTYSDGPLMVMRILGFPYSILFGLCIFPRFFRDGVYRFIAKKRYKWFGKQACLIPDKNLKRRFLPFGDES